LLYNLSWLKDFFPGLKWRQFKLIPLIKDENLGGVYKKVLTKVLGKGCGGEPFFKKVSPNSHYYLISYGDLFL
jgi:hypothetical protein